MVTDDEVVIQKEVASLSMFIREPGKKSLHDLFPETDMISRPHRLL